MYRKWIIMALAAMMLLGPAVPAFAEGEAAPPPVIEGFDDGSGLSEADIGVPGPVVECGAPTTEEPVPAEESGSPATPPEDDSIATVSYEAGTKDAAGGVTTNIIGPTDRIVRFYYYTTGGAMYDNPYFYRPSAGLQFFELWDDQGNGEYIHVSDALPNTLSIYPGTELILEVDPAYDVTISSGKIVRNSYYLGTVNGESGIEERVVNIIAPDSGSMTITIAPATKALPYEVPMTMYGGGLQGDGFMCALVGDETSFGQWSYFEPDEYGTEHGTIYTGTKLCFQLQSGYTIQVVKGGKVVRVGGFNYPTLTTDSVGVDIQVDENATEFVFAILKQGEKFDPNNYTALVDMNKFRDGSADSTSDEPFTDVPSGSWYADDVERARALGVIQGMADNTFKPSAPVTRGQTVTMLYRAKGSPAGGSGAFSDISDAETSSAASWAAAQGIVKGVGGGAFDPGSSLTREQFVTVLYRLAGSPGGGEDVLSQFKDGADTSSYAVDAMNWALNSGVLSGYGDGIIQPRGTATRAEVCALLMRFTGA